MKRIVLVGALLSVSVILAFTVAARAQQVGRQEETTTRAGRFQIVVSPLTRADIFLLDTQTGKIWQPTKYTAFEDEPVAWTLQMRIDSDAALTAWERTLTAKPKP